MKKILQKNLILSYKKWSMYYHNKRQILLNTCYTKRNSISLNKVTNSTQYLGYVEGPCKAIGYSKLQKYTANICHTGRDPVSPAKLQ